MMSLVSAFFSAFEGICCSRQFPQLVEKLLDHGFGMGGEDGDSQATGRGKAGIGRQSKRSQTAGASTRVGYVCMFSASPMTRQMIGTGVSSTSNPIDRSPFFSNRTFDRSRRRRSGLASNQFQRSGGSGRDRRRRRRGAIVPMGAPAHQFDELLRAGNNAAKAAQRLAQRGAKETSGE